MTIRLALKPPATPKDWILLDHGDERLLRRLRGLWFAVEVELLGEAWRLDPVLLKEPDLLTVDRRVFRVLRQRQLNHRELRAHGLHNQAD